MPTTKPATPVQRAKRVQQAIHSLTAARRDIEAMFGTERLLASLSSDERKAWSDIVRRGMDLERDLYVLQRMMERNDEQE